ncbi:carbohydrate-binding domain-containing protein, partial [[Eubacterium] cellulosolvens]
MTKRKLMVFAISFFIILAFAIYFNTVNNNINPTLTDTSINIDNSSHIITCTVAEILDNNQENHEDDEDYNWDSYDVFSITFNTNSISIDDENGAYVRARVNKTTVTITSAGTYSISGTLDNGRIIVDTNDEEVVRLIFNGVNISSATTPPVYIKNAKKAIIILATGTENYVTDNEDNEGKGALFSNDDLTICGDGSLTVSGNANDAIRSDDGLIIKNGDITVTSVDDGIRGKDYLVIKGGSITIYSIGDGLKSDNDEEEDRGYIYVEDGTVNINSTQGDAITAQTDLLITGGAFTLASGSGDYETLDEDVSTKGLKAGVTMIIDDGDFTISSSDDSIHSNDGAVINNGTFNIASGDDAIHADSFVEVNGGDINITKSFEGMDSSVIIINGGDIHIVSSDDGINVVGTDQGTDWGREPPQMNGTDWGREPPQMNGTDWGREPPQMNG